MDCLLDQGSLLVTGKRGAGVRVSSRGRSNAASRRRRGRKTERPPEPPEDAQAARQHPEAAREASAGLCPLVRERGGRRSAVHLRPAGAGVKCAADGATPPHHSGCSGSRARLWVRCLQLVGGGQLPAVVVF